ncbi:hypothetical protein [Pseudooceanicola sp. LIPI14-2-Ac024]|uniref:hypothetical protein n=1 Tax=Pseudooceanicola sp. LIPI14-2-Ac024 TaxID=3344875 RepID=UPI0035CFF7C0
MAASKELGKDDTPRRPRSEELSEVADYLNSDDWQSRVARARIQRERVLAERARQSDKAAPAAPEGEEPPATLADGAFMRRAEEARLARRSATSGVDPAPETPAAPAAAPTDDTAAVRVAAASQIQMVESPPRRRRGRRTGTMVLLVLGATLGAVVAYLAILLLAPRPVADSMPAPAPVESGALAPAPAPASVDHAVLPAPALTDEAAPAMPVLAAQAAPAAIAAGVPSLDRATDGDTPWTRLTQVAALPEPPVIIVPPVTSLRPPVALPLRDTEAGDSPVTTIPGAERIALNVHATNPEAVAAAADTLQAAGFDQTSTRLRGFSPEVARVVYYHPSDATAAIALADLQNAEVALMAGLTTAPGRVDLYLPE